MGLKVQEFKGSWVSFIFGYPTLEMNIIRLKERGQINFPNYVSQLQAILARSKSTKTLK